MAFGCRKEPLPEPDPQPEPQPLEAYYEQVLFHPGDYGSARWRIPALRVLQDGTLLAFADKRKYNNSDLPEDIDIVLRSSSDCGRTWTDPQTIAEGTGRKQGFGDCAVVEAEDGTVVIAYVGGNGLWASTVSDPQCSYIQLSHDGGLTWEERRDVTSLLWDGSAYKGAFFGSGNGLLIKNGAHKGRIMFVSALVRKSANVLDNFAFYSDDNGLTWQRSQRAFTSGDEAKVVELNNGDILMSIRQSGARGYAISHDGGETWSQTGHWPELTTNACNGDIIRYNNEILLHSLPNSMQREKVSIFLSRDEGKTWQLAKELHAGSSCYSSLTVLPDGRIAALVEVSDEGNDTYQLKYYCFTLEWLLS